MSSGNESPPLAGLHLQIDGCLACGHAIAPLFILSQSGYPPGDPRHNIAYSHAILSHCSDCQTGQLEILEHDCFDYEDVWNQPEWYQLDSESTRALRNEIERCSTPLQPGCNCLLHKRLRAAARSLPRRSWSTVFEQPQHVHRIRVTAQRKGIGLAPSDAAPSILEPSPRPPLEEASSNAGPPGGAMAVFSLLFGIAAIVTSPFAFGWWSLAAIAAAVILWSACLVSAEHRGCAMLAIPGFLVTVFLFPVRSFPAWLWWSMTVVASALAWWRSHKKVRPFGESSR